MDVCHTPSICKPQVYVISTEAVTHKVTCRYLATVLPVCSAAVGIVSELTHCSGRTHTVGLCVLAQTIRQIHVDQSRAYSGKTE